MYIYNIYIYTVSRRRARCVRPEMHHYRLCNGLRDVEPERRGRDRPCCSQIYPSVPNTVPVREWCPRTVYKRLDRRSVALALGLPVTPRGRLLLPLATQLKTSHPARPSLPTLCLHRSSLGSSCQARCTLQCVQGQLCQSCRLRNPFPALHCARRFGGRR